MNTKKKIALFTAGSLLSVGGLYAISTSANAAAPSAPAVSSPASGIQVPSESSSTDGDNLQIGDQTGLDSTSENQVDSTGEASSDGTDVGPDANLNEPGHQDATSSIDAPDSEGTSEQAGA